MRLFLSTLKCKYNGSYLSVYTMLLVSLYGVANYYYLKSFIATGKRHFDILK